MDDTGREDGGAGRRMRYAHRWLLLIPFVWQVVLAPFVNDVALRPFGLPFPMLWQMLGILVATAAIGCVYVIDRRQEAANGSADRAVEP